MFEFLVEISGKNGGVQSTLIGHELARSVCSAKKPVCQKRVLVYMKFIRGMLWLEDSLLGIRFTLLWAKIQHTHTHTPTPTPTPTQCEWLPFKKPALRRYIQYVHNSCCVLFIPFRNQAAPTEVPEIPPAALARRWGGKVGSWGFI